jgi:hypothetical protein
MRYYCDDTDPGVLDGRHSGNADWQGPSPKMTPPVKCDCDITWRQSLLIMVGGLALAAVGIAFVVRWML